MMRSHSVVGRLLFCPLAGFGFILVTSLARLLGGRIVTEHPVNWFEGLTQLPMPVTLIVFLFFLVIGSWAGMLVLGAGCTVGAMVAGWASNLPVDYSHGYPLNYRGGYVNSGMTELVIGMASILLAVLVTLVIAWLQKRKEKEDTLHRRKESAPLA